MFHRRIKHVDREDSRRAVRSGPSRSFTLKINRRYHGESQWRRVSPFYRRCSSFSLLIVRNEDGTDASKRVPDVNHRVCMYNERRKTNDRGVPPVARSWQALSTIVIASNELYRDAHLIHPRARCAQCTLARARSSDTGLSDARRDLKISEISGRYPRARHH